MGMRHRRIHRSAHYPCESVGESCSYHECRESKEAKLEVLSELGFFLGVMKNLIESFLEVIRVLAVYEEEEDASEKNSNGDYSYHDYFASPFDMSKYWLEVRMCSWKGNRDSRDHDRDYSCVQDCLCYYFGSHFRGHFSDLDGGSSAVMGQIYTAGGEGRGDFNWSIGSFAEVESDPHEH